ncbi:MAG: ABC transporter ATP-binding protein, partial [Hyphomicrobiales bacterium]|nr:ABC transporter ATP-binding protein [Hyphomicrobiales bacterium]
MNVSKAELSSGTYPAAVLIRRLLIDEALAHWPRYAVAVVLMCIAAGAMALSAYLIGTMTNEAYINHNFRGIVVVGIVVMAVFTTKGIATYGGTVLLSYVGNRIVADNQRRMFDKLLRENMSFFADRHSSEFIARLTTGAGSVSQVINLLITAIGRDLMSLIGLCAVMVIRDPVMSVAALVIAPPALFLLRKLVRRVRNIAQKQFTGGTRTIETMQESLQGLRMVKAFSLEEEMRRRLDDSVTGVEAQANKMARVANRSNPIMETLAGFAIALAIIYGGYRGIAGHGTPGEFVSFLAAFLLAYEPAKRLARLNMDLHNNLVGVRVLYEIIDSPAGETNDDECPPLELTTGRLEFSDVRFAYRAGTPVLRGMSFVAQPGKFTALVGPSGGGKTTVLDLILRFYTVESGRILIDGQDIAMVRRDSLRHQIAYVGQIVQLFRGTIRDNIALGRLGASEAEIVAAAKAAHAHEFIRDFPAGYDTPVGEHGMQLSGGQRQRLAIARALLKNAPILVLDEATSALDSESEQLVQTALANLMLNRTSFVIAHRLSTIRRADAIVVLERGRVVEVGRHDELLARP